MSEIFKITLEPVLDFKSLTPSAITEKLKNWRINMSEEINCLLFIQNKIEKSTYVNFEKDIQEKYSLIFSKLQELCTQEISLISEGIIDIDNINKIKNNDINDSFIIFDKINFILNNYNQIIDNINQTISSMPSILDLYLLYIKQESDNNKYIRENINEEQKNCSDKKKKNDVKIFGYSTKNSYRSNNSENSKLSRRLNYSKNLNKKNIISKTSIKNDENKIKENIINENNNLKKTVFETKRICEEMKKNVNENCVNQNELKTYMKIKEDNIFLSNEIENMKGDLKNIENLYNMQIEKLKNLYDEQLMLANENNYLCNLINQKIHEYEMENDNNMNNIQQISTTNMNLFSNNINKNMSGNYKNIVLDDIIPQSFESTEMLKRLNKY